MIKSAQVEDLDKAGFHYITAITKAQIRAMMKKGVFQLGLFDEPLCEVVDGAVRYVLRRNLRRAEDRAGKLSALAALCEKQNIYLAEHRQADPIVAWRKVLEKAERLGLGALVKVTCSERRVRIEVDAEYMAELAELDGCYALKTNLPAEVADKQIVHDRY